MFGGDGLCLFTIMFVGAISVVLLYLAASVHARAQKAFAINSPISPSFDRYDDGLFSPLEDLSLLSISHFTTLSHPAFPKYGVRVKKSRFCDGNIRWVVYATFHA